jgi:hypothetical protein
MDRHGAKETRQRHRLELDVYKVPDLRGESVPFGPCREGFPVEVDGHTGLVS